MGVNFPEKSVTLENMATGMGLRVHVSVSGRMYASKHLDSIYMSLY